MHILFLILKHDHKKMNIEYGIIFTLIVFQEQKKYSTLNKALFLLGFIKKA